ncbi:MAG TPA: hypothetical protein VGH47_07375 [Xanthobacteraceae bacterium]|jgi:hypothetical protein
MPTITVHDKLKCARRELKYRQFVYPRRVAENKMAQSEADKELAVMSAIVDDYDKSADEQEDLFAKDAT